MNGNGFWISIDNLEILGNWWMEMFSISNILLLFASFFEFFRQSEREGGFSEYDFYCISFEIAGLLSFCLLFVFWEDEKNWCFLEFWGYLYCVIPWDLNFFRPLFFVVAIFPEDERDWNEYFGFIRDFYCTSFEDGGIEYFEFSLGILWKDVSIKNNSDDSNNIIVCLSKD